MASAIKTKRRYVDPERESLYQEMLHDIRVQKRFRVDPSLARPKVVFTNCHYCGYSPDDVPSSGICPKCGGSSWERFALSSRLVPEHMLPASQATHKQIA